eukprot:GHVO01039315.1.p1 GENE.GHVO01039315.1~~GHVO01039315.1.p1  ORF type:complete len:267 (+),score=50.52 GHVO01039315.1:2-802(+)
MGEIPHTLVPDKWMDIRIRVPLALTSPVLRCAHWLPSNPPQDGLHSPLPATGSPCNCCRQIIPHVERLLLPNAVMQMPPTIVSLPCFVILWTYERRAGGYDTFSVGHRTPPWGSWVSIHAQFFPVKILGKTFKKNREKKMRALQREVLDEIHTVHSEEEARRLAWGLSGCLEACVKKLGIKDFKVQRSKSEWDGFPESTMDVRCTTNCGWPFSERSYSGCLREPHGRVLLSGFKPDKRIAKLIDMDDFYPLVLHIDPTENDFQSLM